MDFLWHRISEKEKKEIKKQAKEILDNFSNTLKKVEKQKTGSSFVERKDQTRKETDVIECDSTFRKLFFENAPKKDGDWIKAEKGAWK